MLKRRSCIRIANSILILVLSILMGFRSPLWAASAEEERAAKLVESARKEGRVIWHTQMGPAESSTVLKKFEEKYPFIRGELFSLSGSKLITKIMAEVASGTYTSDVISMNGFHLNALRKKGLFEQYISPQSLAYPEGAKDFDGYGTSLYLNVKVLAYHTKLVSSQDLPKNYEDLLGPKWKGGKIAIDDSEEEWYANTLKVLGRERGLDLMKKIALQQPQIRRQGSLRAPLLAAGEFAATLPVNVDIVERLKTSGARIDWTGLEPVIALKHMAVFTARAPHPNAAKLFIDFLLSKEGQGIMVDLKKIPARADMEQKIAGLKDLKLYYSDQRLADNIKEIGREYAEIFRMKKL